MKKRRKSTPRPRKKKSPPQDLEIPDRRLMEKAMADMARLLEGREFSSIDEMNAFLQEATKGGVKAPEPATPLERAQEVMYEAWEASGTRRAALAQKALDVSPDCADAYVLLAEETATSPEEARALYQKGVEAGERALGPEFFEENVGHFWGIVETRPYMRAREGLAHALWMLGEHERAIEHFEELLRLNPGDNQGIRLVLARYLLAKKDTERLAPLFARYPDDGTAEWLYNRVLYLFQAKGEGDEASGALAAALNANLYVVPYLLGVMELPDRPPAYFSPGDESEAVLYVGYCAMPWYETPGALDWFFDQIQQAMAEREEQESTRGTRRQGRPRTRTTRKTAPAGGTVHQLKVTLRRMRPPIWRRLLVPSETKLSDLHDILQVAMGWTNSHPHMFQVGRVVYGIPSPEVWTEIHDERTVTLAKVLPRAKSKLIYEYDFGDSWEHEVVVEKILDPDPGAVYPLCTAGRRACPPEDCGGAWGYAKLLEAIKDPEHPEHDELIEWVDDDFDPEAFDREGINEALRSLG